MSCCFLLETLNDNRRWINNIITIELLQMETNSSSANLLSRSKKLPPPPLCLPATNTMTDEEKILNSNQQRERKKSSNNCCLSSSSEDCPHKSITYILPFSQRPQILETLIGSSSVLLAPPPSETKHKKAYTAAYANQINLLKQRQSTSKGTVTDAEWLDFMRLVVHKPLENELKLLLDKYKMTYFDRVNAPNTTDDTIRSSLCSIVTETLATYSSSLILPSETTDELTTNACSPIPTITITNSGSIKRKRKNTGTTVFISAPLPINSQTKFVISHIIPGKYDNNNNGNKIINQQKQFQKKYSHLFKYTPSKDELANLLREGHVKNSLVSRSLNNNSICFMLLDEVVNNMDDYDLELSGISIDDSFLLPETLLTNIISTLQ
ncbi:unnamed protein product [Adineta steineri]|uniref:Uncharacterized protein n=1 Tax=Adineta steineri TaxID=433720 RepID=A0A819AWH6_9BILA|nr:unnamed protein product [Adineta steineri]CAF3791754.1 unnamed protein product [Adineta steineri]